MRVFLLSKLKTYGTVNAIIGATNAYGPCILWLEVLHCW